MLMTAATTWGDVSVFAPALSVQALNFEDE
jgi:hypothetical protein